MQNINRKTMAKISDKYQTITQREYYYTLLLEKWFLSKEKNLRDLRILIDDVIPYDIENRELNQLLRLSACIYDCLDTSTSSKEVKLCVKLIKKIHRMTLI